MAAQIVLAQSVLARGVLTVRRSTAVRSLVGTPLAQKSLVRPIPMMGARVGARRGRWD